MRFKKTTSWSLPAPSRRLPVTFRSHLDRSVFSSSSRASSSPRAQKSFPWTRDRRSVFKL
eukprot:9383539-Pyramimonas_sp.AAC.1